MKLHKYIIIILLLMSVLAGCATSPVRERTLIKSPTYDIKGIPYVSLSSVVDAYKLKHEWDSISKKLTLYKGDKHVVLALTSDIALVDGMPLKLSGPLSLYKSSIVMPKDFSESMLKKVFVKKRAIVPRREKPVKPDSAYTIRKIVIDPGHGGKDPGAIGRFALREKDITLDISKRLKRYLEDFSIDVYLTRSDDRFISLWRRADIANKKGADFFISIHANAAHSRQAKGFEVFYLSEAVDDNARAVAAAENAYLKYEDSSFGYAKPSNSLEATLWDMRYSENRRESIELAKCITRVACRQLKVKDRGEKGARFYVLKGAEMPSVLVEVGFISNRQEARKLKDSFYREKVAKAIASGIITYKNKYETEEGFTR
jgi:N-acetylmuramoyl-L-alanine amidase